jgi:hypothetical protein
LSRRPVAGRKCAFITSGPCRRRFSNPADTMLSAGLR